MSTWLSPNFYIGHIRISSIEGASCFNMGNNWPSQFESFSKRTQGFGDIVGDGNMIKETRSEVDDADLLDMLNLSDNEDIPDWVKDLILEASHHVLQDPHDPL